MGLEARDFENTKWDRSQNRGFIRAQFLCYIVENEIGKL
jgi:hypothetical protein